MLSTGFSLAVRQQRVQTTNKVTNQTANTARRNAQIGILIL